ncbi:C39 family peptidase [Enterococcus devriesei]
MKNGKIVLRLLPIAILCLALFGFKYSEGETVTNDTQTELSSTLTAVSESKQTTEKSTGITESSLSTTETSSTQEPVIESSDEPDIARQNSSIKEKTVSEQFFITITDKNYILLRELNGEAINDHKENFQKTFIAEKITSNDGIEYYSLSTPTKKLGYIKATSVEKTTGQEGKLFLEDNSYANVIDASAKLYTPEFQENGTVGILKDQTLKIVGFYNHYNGTKFYLLKNSDNQPASIVEAKALQKTTNQGGKWNGTNQYITVTKNDWTIWKDFNFNSGNSTKNLYQRTYRVTGWYRHFNGSKYLSVYDNKGTWQGYLNEGATQVINGQGGKWNGTNQYITVTKNDWTIWKDFNFNSGSSTKNLYQRTYRVTGWYRHFNGSKYLSIYDNKGTWQGYLNEEGTKGVSSYVLLDAPYINQNSSGFPMGCEAASLLQALQLKGYAKNYNLRSFIKEMPLSPNNNPNNGFSGRPDIVKPDIYQSIFAKPLAQWGTKYGKAADITGASVNTLKDELRKGNSVVVYVTLYYAAPQYEKYWWGTGIDNAHIVTLDGFNQSNNTYHISDPNEGKYWVSAAKFESSYNLRKSAVVVR